MSSSGGQSGQSHEPVGADRFERARWFAELRNTYGVAPETIAEREGLSRATVYRMLREVGALSPTPAPAVGPVAVAVEQGPRKLSARVLLDRAWLTLHLDGGLRSSDVVARHLWLEVVMAIHGKGDGERLLYAEAGFEDGADFAVCYGGTSEALAHLVRRRVLLDLGGAGIALPPQLGLLPKERKGGRLMPSASRGRGPDPRQFGMLHALPGGRSASGSEPRGGVAPCDSESQAGAESGVFESHAEGDSCDSLRLPRATTTTTTLKDSNTLSSSSSNPASARESQNTGFGETQIPVSKGLLTSQQSEEPGAVSVEAMALVDQVVRLARPGRAPSSEDLDVVREWLARGWSASRIIGIVEAKMAARKGRPLNTLSYFSPAFAERMPLSEVSAPVAAGAAPAAAPAVALSAEEQALADRLRALQHPFSPSLSALKAGDPRSPFAARWLAAAEVWAAAGRPAALRPPDFTLVNVSRPLFLESLERLEEEMTAPASAAGA